MSRSVVAAVVVVLAGADAVSAQVYYAPVYGPGFGGGFAYRTRFGFSAGGIGFRAGGFAGGYYGAPGFYGWTPVAGPGFGPGYGNPYFLPPPAGAFPPGYIPPFFGFGLGNNVPAVPADPAAAVFPPARPPGEALQSAPRRSDFIVITPRTADNKAAALAEKVAAAQKANPEGTITPKIDRVAPPPERPQPQPARFNPFAPQPPMGKTEKPEADATAESARLVRLARTALAAGEYGRAVEHLDRAVTAKSDDSLSYFLRAQAEFATGQYGGAVADIKEGMKRAPDWPDSGFKPKDLYGDKPEPFDAQLAALRKVLAANPAEPSLQFLLGYELWFTGDRPAAVALFRDAAKVLNDPAIVERFLREADKRAAGK